MINLKNKIYVYDIEADGLLNTATIIHCLSITWRDKNGNIKVKSTSDYNEMRKFFTNPNITRCGHNITLYDERIIQKLLGIDTSNNREQIIDTLAISWYLFPELKRHGLEEWGVHFGVRKVKIDDWKNLTREQYIKRCEVDTHINLLVWEFFLDKLQEIYDNNEQEIIRFISYLQFKLDCFREQEEKKIKLDIPHIKKVLAEIITLKKEKARQLESVMPKVTIKKQTVYNNVIVLEDGSFYQQGDMMYDYYFREGYRPKMTHTVEVIKGYEAPNINSGPQKKAWLYSLGWVPDYYEERKKKDGRVEKVPQISSREKDGSVSESVRKLFKVEPKLELLEGLSILTHRIGLLKGLLRDQEDGYIEASIAGLTNTLRIKHSKIVNLPGVRKPYGKDIRGSLIAREDKILCGSDMSSLEDTTKQHYIYNYDPKYVKEMRTPGFDPHLDIAVKAQLLTEAQADEHKLYSKTKGKEGVDHSEVRYIAKTTNFSATYGAGAAKIAETAGKPLKVGKQLHKIYWERNKAVKQTAEACTVKTIGNKKWLYNPVSGFWYSLRAEKDRFSTLNQGTGVYCFDNYVMEARSRGIIVSLQMHDEILFETCKETEDEVKLILKESIKAVNQKIKLNVPLGISIDFGRSYASVH